MFISGTATDYIDLADKLRLWLTGTVGWTQLAWTPGDVTTGGMVLNLRAPGSDVDRRVFINLRSVHDDGASLYSWEVRGAVGYDSGNTFTTQPGTSEATYLSLWKNTIAYWFYANARRVIVVCKVNTVYVSMYAGFFLPWALPAEYPFPLYIAGSDGTPRAYNSGDSAHTSMCDPGGLVSSSVDLCSGKIRLPNGSWKRVLNRRSSGNNDYPYAHEAGDNPSVWPYGNRSSWSNAGFGRTFFDNLIGGGPSMSGGVFDGLAATAQGERLMLPALLMHGKDPGGYGALDGAYFPMGDGLTPEQTGTYGLRTFRAFPNIARTSSNDFFMVEEV